MDKEDESDLHFFFSGQGRGARTASVSLAWRILIVTGFFQN
ncbi:hypothetical protein [Clostridioides difficile]|nr:hypothetical protein [Clostridioides difficile]